MFTHRVPVACLLLAAGVVCADPIDDFLRSPGSTGDPVLAARMFAWCSARYELSAWLERTSGKPDQRWSVAREEDALGSRAAGAYRIYAAWVSGLEPRPGTSGADGPDFSSYLSVVESMAVQDGREIDERLAAASGQPGGLTAALAGLTVELRRCWSDAEELKHFQVARMTPEQIAIAKARPRMISRRVPPG